MLTIICGEDTVASRKYFSDLKHSFISKGNEVKHTTHSDLVEIPKWLAESVSLFGERLIFFSENINKLISRRKGDQLMETLKTIADSKDAELFIWEEAGGREIKLKGVGQIKEFKPKETIFKLLEACYPSNKNQWFTLLSTLSQSTDEYFMFVMLHRHIRKLILASMNIFPKEILPWQKQKIAHQAKQWRFEHLVNFYEGLIKIDISTKTGTNPYGIKKSLEILMCYFL